MIYQYQQMLPSVTTKTTEVLNQNLFLTPVRRKLAELWIFWESKTSISPVPCVISFTFLGDLQNYTFLERLGPTEPKSNVYIFSKHPMAAILNFQNGDYFFAHILQYLGFKHLRLLLLVSIYTFSETRNLMRQLTMHYI